jgi:ribonuclease T2
MALALVLALSLATLAAPASFMGGEIAGGQAPGDFSMYVFAMSWKPQWCHGASSKQPGCMRPRDYWLSHMTLHGLWPDNGDGTYPTKCTAEAFDYDLVTSAIGLDKLEKLWPNVQKSEGSSDYESFWEHEWTKHGTCTGLSQVQYFETAMKVLTAVGTPDSIVGEICTVAT